MPQQQIVPTWLAWNNANFTSPTALTDLRTGQPFAAGGLNLGDYFDATEQEANAASYTTNGTLHSGRYRFVQVDSGANSSNVKTGTVGYLRSGTSVAGVVVTNVGSGQTAGTYTISASPASGGGVGAVIQVVVGTGGTITSVSVLQGGYNYVSVPNFILTALGGTPGSVVAQLGITMNIVTSADQGLGASGGTPAANQAGVGPVHPVVFLNSIAPGNYGFVQELGVASVLSGAATQTVSQFAIVLSTTPNGTLTGSSATFGPFAIGNIIDTLAATPLANTPIKVLLDGPAVQD